MFELFGFATALLVIGAIVAAAIVSLALPIGWVWMLVDAILREDADYPGASANSRLMWVLLIALLPITAFAYFFLVYAKAKRGASGPSPATMGTTMQVAPPAPAAVTESAIQVSPPTASA